MLQKFFIPAIIFLAYFFNLSNNSLAYHTIMVYVIWGYNVFYSLGDVKKHFPFLLFQITFFTFLLGQPLATFFSKDEIFGEVALWEFSNETQEHVVLLLFLSLYMLNLGYNLAIKRQSKSTFVNYDFVNSNMIRVRRLSKNLMYICAIPAIFSSLERAIFVLTYGYVSLYTNYESSLPSIVNNLTVIYQFSFYLYLATLPTKKECKKPILLYLTIGLITLGSGHRGQTVLYFAFVLLYYAVRDYIKIGNTSEIWLSKRLKRTIVLASPFVIVFLMMYGTLRLQTGDSSGYSNFFDNILAFFYQQGGSVSVIAYGYDYSKQIADGNYTFGFIRDAFTFGESLTMEQRATCGRYYAAALTYLTRPEYYLNGGGIGNCYIAEIFQDFGYIGVTLINIVYGYILAMFYSILRSGNLWKIFFSFVIITKVLYAPRSESLAFLSVFISFTFLFFLVVIAVFKKKSYSHGTKAVSECNNTNI